MFANSRCPFGVVMLCHILSPSGSLEAYTRWYMTTPWLFATGTERTLFPV